MEQHERKERLTEEEAIEDIERVGKALKEPRWWETLVKNQADADAIFELARDCGYKDVKPGELKKIKEFIEELSKGIYIGPLESYDVHWPAEKLARDIWQNFFDGNKQTLDGIFPDIKPAEHPYLRIRIEGAREYDFRKLLHFGGTSKSGDEKAAGGFGEGAKVAAFLLLRDYKADVVRFGSGDWVLEYYLDTVPEEQYDKPVRGLHVRLKKVEHREGNFIEFDGLPIIAAAVEGARNLFYHKDNPDFQNPTFANKHGGFTFLGKNVKGNFYETGQRRHVKEKDRWNTVDGLTLWTWKKIPGTKDRDRGAYNETEIESLVLRPLVDSMSNEEVVQNILNLEQLWYPTISGEGEDIYMDDYKDPKIAVELLRGLLSVAEKKHLKDWMPEGRFVALKGRYNMTPAERLLYLQGYDLVREEFKAFGIPGAEEVLAELGQHWRLEANEQEKEMIGELQGFISRIRLVLGLVGKQPPIWLFSKENEKNIIHGQYSEEHIWMAQERFTDGFVASLRTYLHELCHKYNPSHDTAFVYEFGASVEHAFQYLGDHSDEFGSLIEKFKRLGKEAQNIRALEQEP